jgi:hypothetical protein
VRCRQPLLHRQIHAVRDSVRSCTGSGGIQRLRTRSRSYAALRLPNCSEGAPMFRGAFALLAALLIASRVDATPPADSVIRASLEGAQVIILVHVVESTPPSTRAKVQVLKSWKGPFPAGRVLHVEPPELCGSSTCEPYLFQAGDDQLLIFLFDARDHDPIAAWQGWVWSPAESQALIGALDQAAKGAGGRAP